MFKHKGILLANFAAAALVCGAAMAGDLPVPGPTKTTGPQEFQMECRFSGGSSDKDKSNGWSQRCKAEAQFEARSDDHQHGILNNEENHLEVRCASNDGDQDQDDELRKIFDGGVRVDIDENVSTFKGKCHDHDDLFDHGDQDDEGRCSRPIILISASDEEVLEGDGDRLAADINYTVHGFNFDIPGFCRIKKDYVGLK